MTDAAPSPEEEIAGTLGDLSQKTRNLVRREIESARLEMLEGVKRGAPVLAGALAAGMCGTLALASAYRWTLRMFERRMSPASAAFLAMLAYGGGSVGLGAAAWKKRDALQELLPTRTAQATVAGARQGATEAGARP